MSAWKAALLSVGVVALFLLGGFALFGLALTSGARAKEKALQSPERVATVGRELARLCQACQTHPDWFDDEPIFAPAWAPTAVLALDPSWVMIGSDTAHVEYGGGFHHFGYWLTRDPQSGSGAGASTWVLSLYREERGSTELTRVTLGRDDELTEQQFVDRAFAEFERRIARSVADAGGLIIVGEESDPSVLRCQFALKHGQLDQLKDSIRNTARQHPDAWREVLLVHALDAPLDPRGANERLRQWAASKGDFTAWLLAAYAFDALGDASAAEEAVRTACTYSAISPAWMDGSARYCGYPMCRRLCAAGKFETGVALCDRLLKQQPDDPYLKAEIGKIREACAGAETSGGAAPLPAVGPNELFDPFGGIDLAALRPVAQ